MRPGFRHKLINGRFKYFCLIVRPANERRSLLFDAGDISRPSLIVIQNKCGFIFRKRDRLKKPGRCPVCHGEHIQDPLFSIIQR
jgi:hypothetical protein